MKFAIVCPYDLSTSGGVNNVVIETHKQLIKMGHESTILSVEPKDKVNIDNAVFFGKAVPVTFNKSATTLDLEGLKENQEIEDFFNDNSFDYVYIHEPACPFLNWQVLAHSKSVNIGIFHSTTFVNFNEFPYNIFTFPLDDWIKSKLSGFIAVSPSAEKTWKEIFHHKHYLILGNGVDIKRFREADRIKLGPQFNILFVGRLDERKGVLDAIRMMPFVLKDLSAKLWIVGDGEERGKAKKLVGSLGIQNNVVFVGRVSDAELPRYYKSADVYIAPSLGGESFGIVLIESMAAGTPVIAYANDGYKFPMEGNPWKGSLVKTGSYKSLARSILELAGNNRLRKKVIEWQNRKVKEYAWDKIVDKFLKYLEEIKGP